MAKSSPQGEASGYDAGNKVKGRKRHVLVDTLRMVLAVSVTAASVKDHDGAHPVMANGMEKYAGISKDFVDAGYAGRCAQAIGQQQAISVEIVRHSGNANVVHRNRGASSRDSLMRKASWFSQSVGPERTHVWIEKARWLVMHHG